MSLRKHVAMALLAGLALRLFMVWRFPEVAGDTRIYDDLAINWLREGVYGLLFDGQLTPVDLRVPGYPAFLAAVYSLFGVSHTAVMLVQALVDLGTCLLAAAIATAIAPQGSRERVTLAALWLAVTCPFVANYAAVLLTEVLATFLTAVALLLMVVSMQSTGARTAPTGRLARIPSWFLAGCIVGLATLVRPESPLLLVSTGLVLAILWRRPRDWRQLFSVGVLLLAGVILPLFPWTIRNARTLGRFQPLAPRYVNLPGEFVPRGVYAWTRTWLVRFRDVYRVSWRLEDQPIPIADIPDSAFDSPEERARVTALLAQYNSEVELTPEIDAAFAAIARERTTRHPLRTYVWIPIERAVALWFTPRVELLPYSGNLWPPAEKWRDDPEDFSVSTLLSLLNFFYVGVALWGAWRGRAQPGVWLLAAFILVRTVYFTQIETVEPRYVLVCFPAVVALASLVWTAKPEQARLA